MSEKDKAIAEVLAKGFVTEAEFMAAEYENVSKPKIEGTVTGRLTGPDPQPQWTRPNKGGEQKPAVTREQYAAGRAVLDALPPGYYVKCAVCQGWYMGGEFVISTDGPVCAGCR